MKKVKLGDLGKIITGNTPSKKTLEFYDSNDIPFIKPDDFKTIDEISSSKGNKNYVSENARNSARIVPKNSVLVTCIGIIGKVMISESELSFNQQINAIVPNELILSKYLAYLLLYNKPKLDFISNAPVVPIINKTQFSEFEVTFHKDIDIQEKIIQNLENLDNQILKRRHQSRLLLNLVKSRFNEMFGDDSNFEKVLLSSVCDVRDGTHDSPKYVKKGFPLITSKNVTNGVIDFNNTNYISQLDFEKINQRSKVDYGDILLPMIGTIGNPVVVDTRRMFAIKNVALIKFYNESTVHNIYIKNLLTSFYFDKQVLQKIRGGTQKFIALRDIRGFQIPLPPLSLQNEFADFVGQVDKSQLAIQKSLEELETLKKSLMQEYFG